LPSCNIQLRCNIERDKHNISHIHTHFPFPIYDFVCKESHENKPWGPLHPANTHSFETTCVLVDVVSWYGVAQSEYPPRGKQILLLGGSISNVSDPPFESWIWSRRTRDRHRLAHSLLAHSLTHSLVFSQPASLPFAWSSSSSSSSSSLSSPSSLSPTL
jgi:hypothetical protein